MGSKRQVGGLEVETVEVNWSRLMGEKTSKYTPGHTAASKGHSTWGQIGIGWGQQIINPASNSYNLFIEEVHEVITEQSK